MHTKSENPNKRSMGKFRHKKTDNIQMYFGKIRCENVD